MANDGEPCRAHDHRAAAPSHRRGGHSALAPAPVGCRPRRPRSRRGRRDRRPAPSAARTRRRCRPRATTAPPQAQAADATRRSPPAVAASAQSAQDCPDRLAQSHRARGPGRRPSAHASGRDRPPAAHATPICRRQAASRRASSRQRARQWAARSFSRLSRPSGPRLLVVEVFQHLEGKRRLAVRRPGRLQGAVRMAALAQAEPDAVLLLGEVRGDGRPTASPRRRAAHGEDPAADLALLVVADASRRLCLSMRAALGLRPTPVNFTRV